MIFNDRLNKQCGHKCHCIFTYMWELEPIHRFDLLGLKSTILFLTIKEYYRNNNKEIIITNINKSINSNGDASHQVFKYTYWYLY